VVQLLHVVTALCMLPVRHCEPSGLHN